MTTSFHPRLLVAERGLETFARTTKTAYKFPNPIEVVLAVILPTYSFKQRSRELDTSDNACATPRTPKCSMGVEVPTRTFDRENPLTRYYSSWILVEFEIALCTTLCHPARAQPPAPTTGVSRETSSASQLE